MANGSSCTADQATERKRRLRNLRCSMITCGVLFFIIVVVWIAHVQSNAEQISWMGQFGDSMAALALLATSLALFVTAYSALLQREDIDAQLEELSASREATERLATAEETAQLVASIGSMIDVLGKLVSTASDRSRFLAERCEFEMARAGAQAEHVKAMQSHRETIEKMLGEHGSAISSAGSLLSQVQLAVSLDSKAVPRLKPAIREIIQGLDESIMRITGHTFGSVRTGGDAWARIRFTLDSALGDDRLGNMEVVADIPQDALDRLTAKWKEYQEPKGSGTSSGA